jgi:hypothetical protein
VWANISVASTPKPSLVASGHRIMDTVVVTDRGPSDAEGSMLDYQAPKGTKLISVQTPQGRCSRTLPLICQLGILKPRHKVVLTVVMASAARSGVFRMHAAAGSSSYDPVLSDNSINEQVHIASATPPPPQFTG